MNAPTPAFALPAASPLLLPRRERGLRLGPSGSRQTLARRRLKRVGSPISSSQRKAIRCPLTMVLSQSCFFESLRVCNSLNS
jgi:hypothetical protein